MKEKLKNTYLKYDKSITEEIGDKIFDKLVELGSSRIGSDCDFKGFKFHGYLLIKDDIRIQTAAALSNTPDYTQIQVSDILGSDYDINKSNKWNENTYVVAINQGHANGRPADKYSIGFINKITHKFKGHTLGLEFSQNCVKMEDFKWFVTKKEAEDFSKTLLAKEEYLTWDKVEVGLSYIRKGFNDNAPRTILSIDDDRIYYRNKSGWNYKSEIEGYPKEFIIVSKPTKLTVADLIEGEIYKYEFNYGSGMLSQGKAIIKWNGTPEFPWLGLHSKTYHLNSPDTDSGVVLTKASIHQKKWLNVCIKAGKFIEESKLDDYNDETFGLKSIVPEYKVGKWYKAMCSGNDLYYMKYKEITRNIIRASEFIYQGKLCQEANFNTPGTYDWKEISLTEIQDYLPEGHEDKMKTKYEGKVVHCDTQKEWDFVCDKLIKSTGTKKIWKERLQSGLRTCHYLHKSSCSQSKEYCKANNFQVLSFQEWLDENNYNSEWKKIIDADFKVGDWVIAKGNISGYNTKLGKITQIKGFTDQYRVEYAHNKTEIWSEIIRLATQEEIDAANPPKPKESNPMGQPKFPINPKLKYTIGDKVSYKGEKTIIVAIDDDPYILIPYVIEYSSGWLGKLNDDPITRGSLSEECGYYWVVEDNLTLIGKARVKQKQSDKLLDLLHVDYI